MRLQTAFSISLLFHVGLVGGLWCLNVDHGHSSAEYTVVRGEPIASASSQSAAEQVVMQIRVPEYPSEAEHNDFRPVETAMPPVDVVEITRQSIERPIAHLASRDPIEPSPPSQPTVETIDRQKQPDQSQLDHSTEPAKPLPRRIQPMPLLVQHEAVAIPFQTAAVAGAEVDQVPRKLAANPPPAYPVDALLARVEGRVMIRVLVRADGLVDAASVDTSSGFKSLDEAALLAVRRWRFDPARRGGRAVAYEVIVPVAFAINRS